MASPINGYELGQTLGDGEGHGGLACCSTWSYKESDMTGRLNNYIYNICVIYVIYVYIIYTHIILLFLPVMILVY